MDAKVTSLLSKVKSAKRKRSEIDDTTSFNGQILNDVFIPEELLLTLLLQVDGKSVDACAKVCKKWRSLLQTDSFWLEKYRIETGKPGKRLPGFVYRHFLTTDCWNNAVIVDPKGVAAFPKRCDGPAAAARWCFDVLDKDDDATVYQSDALLLRILALCHPDVYVNGRFIAPQQRGCANLFINFWYGLKRYMSKANASRTGVTDVEIDEDFSNSWVKVDATTFDDYPQLVKHLRYLYYGKEEAFFQIGRKTPLTGVVCKLDFDSIQRRI